MIEISSKVFISVMAIILIFNVAYLLSQPPTEQVISISSMAYGGIIGLIVSAGSVAILSGANILGSGLGQTSVSLIFGIATLLNVLFQITLGPVTLGLGLINPIFAVFQPGGTIAPGFLGLIGFLVATILSIMVLVTGVMTIQGSG